MSKFRLISILAVALFVLNLVLLYFLMNQPGRPNHEGPRDEIIHRLHFDEAQVISYDELIQEHRKSIRAKEEEILTLKNLIYLPLIKTETIAINDSLLQEIVKIQASIETIHYHHLEDLKHLCKPTQVNDFNSLVTELAGLFSHRRQKKAL